MDVIPFLYERYRPGSDRTEFKLGAVKTSINIRSEVGKIDWELRKFHGDEYSTHRGSSYNSYLIKEDKVALIDTVWKPFSKEFIENLAQDIDLNKIDYIIANHAEIDHSGALPELMRHIPDTPIYCTKNGVKSLIYPLIHIYTVETICILLWI